MTQRCARCGETKLTTDFAWQRKSTGKLDAYCCPCRAAYKQEHYKKHRSRYINNAKVRSKRIRKNRTEWMLDFLHFHPCVDCGESNPLVLQFDHITDEKEFDIARALRGDFSFERMVSEINKCEVVCANCHMKRTSKRGGFLKGLLWSERLQA